MIRAKKITYLGQAAIAIYFQNMAYYMKEIRLESQILEQKNRNETLESFTSTISHEFRTPLGTALMFLEQMMLLNLNQQVNDLISLVINQLNLLLCLVNDVLDLKMIEGGAYIAKAEEFSPKNIFDFIVAMFQPQCLML